MCPDSLYRIRISDGVTHTDYYALAQSAADALARIAHKGDRPIVEIIVSLLGSLS